MTAARTVEPNPGGRANTRGRAAVASFTKPDATQAAKRSATASPSSFREAATPNGDPAGRLGDGIVRPAFVAHLATRGCEKEARVVPAIRGASFNAADARSRATHLRAAGRALIRRAGISGPTHGKSECRRRWSAWLHPTAGVKKGKRP